MLSTSPTFLKPSNMTLRRFMISRELTVARLWVLGFKQDNH